jgi:hypothetical protein
MMPPGPPYQRTNVEASEFTQEGARPFSPGCYENTLPVIRSVKTEVDAVLI